MYEVLCNYDVQVLVKDEPYHLSLKQTIQMPFPPYPGLVIDFTKDGEEDPVASMFSLNHAYWMVNEQRFECGCEEDTHIHFGSTEEAKAEFSKYGWKVVACHKEQTSTRSRLGPSVRS